MGAKVRRMFQGPVKAITTTTLDDPEEVIRAREEIRIKETNPRRRAMLKLKDRQVQVQESSRKLMCQKND